MVGEEEIVDGDDTRQRHAVGMIEADLGRNVADRCGRRGDVDSVQEGDRCTSGQDDDRPVFPIGHFLHRLLTLSPLVSHIGTALLRVESPERRGR